MESRIGPAFVPRLVAMADEAIRAVSGWNRRRRAVQDLQSLNDHFLRDLGLRRVDILSAAYGETRPLLRDDDDVS